MKLEGPTANVSRSQTSLNKRLAIGQLSQSVERKVNGLFEIRVGGGTVRIGTRQRLAADQVFLGHIPQRAGQHSPCFIEVSGAGHDAGKVQHFGMNAAVNRFVDRTIGNHGLAF